MADRFYNDIELPDVGTGTPPAPDVGFVQVYGKGGKLAYQDPLGNEVILDGQVSDFSTIVVDDYIQQGTGERVIRGYVGGFTGAFLSIPGAVIFPFAAITLDQNSAVQNAISIVGSLHIEQEVGLPALGGGGRIIDFRISAKLGVGALTVRYSFDLTEHDVNDDLGSFAVYRDPSVIDGVSSFYLCYLPSGSTASSFTFKFDAALSPEAESVFIISNLTDINPTNFVAVAPNNDATGRTISQRIVAPRFTGNIVGDNATYGTPVTIGAANNPGTGTLFARSNHVHAHGNQAGGATHAVATTTVNGFMSAADKLKLDGLEQGASGVPTFIEANKSFKLAKNTQVLFSDEIDMEAGAEIDFDENSVLTEVS